MQEQCALPANRFITGYITQAPTAVNTIPGTAIVIRISGSVPDMPPSTSLPAMVPRGPLTAMVTGFTPNNARIPPATRRNIMAMVTFTMVWVPRIRLIALARIPIRIYFRKPKQAAMHTAKGAESWNSHPGTMLGSFSIPRTANITAKSAVVVISNVFSLFFMDIPPCAPARTAITYVF